MDPGSEAAGSRTWCCPRRWMVERTFAWLMHSRRLACDYEALTVTSEAMIQWPMMTRMNRRLGRHGPAAPLNIPDDSWSTHACSARRLALDRTPATLIGVGSSATAVSPYRPLARPAGPPACAGAAASPAREPSPAAPFGRTALSFPATARKWAPILTPPEPLRSSRQREGLDKPLPRDPPAVQLDLGRLQHRSHPGRRLPQILDSHVNSHFPWRPRTTLSRGFVARPRDASAIGARGRATPEPANSVITIMEAMAH
jgi:hypothetical protein